MAGRFSVEAAFKAIDQFTAPLAKMQAATDRMLGGLSSGLK
jgi:hypothetical protein